MGDVFPFFSPDSLVASALCETFSDELSHSLKLEGIALIFYPKPPNFLIHLTWSVLPYSFSVFFLSSMPRKLNLFILLRAQDPV